MEELQAVVIARDKVIAQNEVTIGHREDQIVENDALISQHNIVIEFLQEQVQDLTLELDDANAYIEFLCRQYHPISQTSLREMKKKTPKRLKEFLTLTLSTKV